MSISLHGSMEIPNELPKLLSLDPALSAVFSCHPEAPHDTRRNLHGRTVMSRHPLSIGRDVSLMHRALPRAHLPLRARDNARPVPWLVAREMPLLFHPRWRTRGRRRSHHPSGQNPGLAPRLTCRGPQIDMRPILLRSKAGQRDVTCLLLLQRRLRRARGGGGLV